ncbi:hypothetical protein [Paenibacillus sp. PL91]|uniref:hypothetical protein n=1 Tax=Paenibacillus sp. PL91 TaxID=2729538 RepID=UPI00145D8118|nr:hypothetical protein [Paenibacillus sp. PL91]MBC9205008.1 hypothetical protein [Paenibacillus sp. PL91]
MLENKFTFKTNQDSQDYVIAIAAFMMKSYKVSNEEAVGRINNFWCGNDFTDENSMLFHETPEFWANEIYLEDEFWWEKDITTLVPREYKKMD